MPIFRIEIDQPLVGEPLDREGVPCHVSATDPEHAIRLLRSNVSMNLAGVPLKATESEAPEGMAPDWRTMILTPEAFAEWQATAARKSQPDSPQNQSGAT